MDPKVLAITTRVMRKVWKVDRPACNVYLRPDRILVQPLGLYGQMAKAPTGGPVRVLPGDADARQVGEAALAALAAFELHPDAPPSPPKDSFAPLLKAAGVKTLRGLDRATPVSVERVGKQVAVVPLVWQETGAFSRDDTREVRCAARADAVGEAVRRLLGQYAKVNRYHRAQHRKFLPEIEAEQRTVSGPTGKRARGRKATAGPARSRGARPRRAAIK